MHPVTFPVLADILDFFLCTVARTMPMYADTIPTGSAFLTRARAAPHSFCKNVCRASANIPTESAEFNFAVCTIPLRMCVRSLYRVAIEFTQMSSAYNRALI